MKKITKFTALLLALILMFSLAACSSAVPAESPAPAQSASPAPEVSEAPEQAEQSDEKTDIVDAGLSGVFIDRELPVSIMVLNGTTGFGMAKLISDVQQEEAVLNYSFSVEADASNITAALINGSVDIAALPTNAAAAVYNKTEGAVQLLALNTRGVLHLVVNGEKESIESLADLEGKTVYAPAQNPSFIFSYICLENGINVTIDNTYAQPADLRTAVAAGEVDIAVLPEPMVTIALSANENLYAALDLTAEWDEIAPVGSLVQGCVVVRREFAEAHPTEVEVFLDEYAASIEFLGSDPDSAAQMIEDAGIFQKAAVAKKALPGCNVCFVKGEEMRESMAYFLDIMYSVAPASIGGAVPGEDFYYIP